MKFKPTHSSIDLEELVMIKGGVVYRWDADFMDIEAVGYAWEYEEENLLPLYD